MSTAGRFKPYAPDVHARILLEEALPPEHPVHVFVDLVQSVDLTHFVVPPGPKGEKPYHPHALFGVLAWGYLHGVRSSRKLARLARQEATFVYLAGGGAPHYRTLARFRRENAAAFTAVFQETVILALRLGLAKLGHVALDGTKLRASTSKHKAMSYGRMKQREAQLTEEIARLVERAEAQDEAEDQEYGVDSDGYAVDDELALRGAAGQDPGAAPAPGGGDARRAGAGGGRGVRHRGRGAAVVRGRRRADDAAQARRVPLRPQRRGGGRRRARGDRRGRADQRGPRRRPPARPGGAHPGAARRHRTAGRGDHGQRRRRVLQGREHRPNGDGIDLLISGNRGDPAAASLPEPGRVWPADAFGYDAARDVWIRPTGKLLARQQTRPGARGRPAKDRYRGDPADGGPCPLRAACLKPGQERRVLVAQRGRPTGGMRHKLRRLDARRRYARRKSNV